MPVLSIVACGILEDELAHVLRDCEIKQLIVVEQPYLNARKRVIVK